jgi:hypothetical protein
LISLSVVVRRAVQQALRVAQKRGLLAYCLAQSAKTAVLLQLYLPVVEEMEPRVAERLVCQVSVA